MSLVKTTAIRATTTGIIACDDEQPRYDILEWESVEGEDHSMDTEKHYEPDLNPCHGLTRTELKSYVDQYIDHLYVMLSEMGEINFIPRERYCTGAACSKAQNIIYDMPDSSLFIRFPLMMARNGDQNTWGLVAYPVGNTFLDNSSC